MGENNVTLVFLEKMNDKIKQLAGQLSTEKDNVSSGEILEDLKGLKRRYIELLNQYETNKNPDKILEVLSQWIIETESEKVNDTLKLLLWCGIDAHILFEDSDWLYGIYFNLGEDLVCVPVCMYDERRGIANGVLEDTIAILDKDKVMTVLVERVKELIKDSYFISNRQIDIINKTRGFLSE